jgi:hypothetical protein
MIFNSVVARNSVYLDFEGEGKSKNTGIPLPHMAGIFRPNQDKGSGGKYEAIFFKESWKPCKNGSKGKGRVADFATTIENLIREAKDKNAYIVFWSDYERSVIELNVPELLVIFESVGFNLLPPLKTIKNSRVIALDQKLEKVLNQYLKAFLPNRPLVPTYKLGPAEACRRIDNFSERYTRWRNWPTEKKQYLYDLLKYNEQDCRATWWLGRKLGNINQSRTNM